MMKKLAILFTALFGCAFASGQDEIWLNPDTAYAEANATAAKTVCNAAGQTVLIRANAPSFGLLEVSTLSPGLYILNVRTKEGRLVAAKKFSVK